MGLFQGGLDLPRPVFRLLPLVTFGFQRRCQRQPLRLNGLEVLLGLLPALDFGGNLAGRGCGGRLGLVQVIPQLGYLDLRLVPAQV